MKTVFPKLPQIALLALCVSTNALIAAQPANPGPGGGSGTTTTQNQLTLSGAEPNVAVTQLVLSGANFGASFTGTVTLAAPFGATPLTVLGFDAANQELTV